MVAGRYKSVAYSMKPVSVPPPPPGAAAHRWMVRSNAAVRVSVGNASASRSPRWVCSAGVFCTASATCTNGVRPTGRGGASASTT